jgi:lysine 2,3-aminomutase
LGLYHSETDFAGTDARKSTVMGRAALLEERPELAEAWDEVDRLFRVQTTRSFWEKARNSVALSKQILPDARELDEHDADLDDPVGEKTKVPVPWVVHKYERRALLLLTKRCHIYCRYCFRRTHDPSERLDPSPEELAAAIAYIQGSGVSEVILSGGDPLAVRDSLLFRILDELAVIPTRRVHTRAPIVAPNRITDELVEGLAARAPVWVIVHANHPDELGPDTDAALARLVDAGIPVLNQSVLLRGVNDDADTLRRLCEALVERRVRPYYLHHPDAVTGNAHFRVSQSEGLALYRTLRSSLSGLALPRYVLDRPDGGGKVDVERFVLGG